MQPKVFLPSIVIGGKEGSGIIGLSESIDFLSQESTKRIINRYSFVTFINFILKANLDLKITNASFI